MSHVLADDEQRLSILSPPLVRLQFFIYSPGGITMFDMTSATTPGIQVLPNREINFGATREPQIHGCRNLAAKSVLFGGPARR